LRRRLHRHGTSAGDTARSSVAPVGVAREERPGGTFSVLRADAASLLRGAGTGVGRAAPGGRRGGTDRDQRGRRFRGGGSAERRAGGRAAGGGAAQQIVSATGTENYDERRAGKQGYPSGASGLTPTP